MDNDNIYKENDLPNTTKQVRGTAKSFLLSTPARVQHSENTTFPTIRESKSSSPEEEEIAFEEMAFISTDLVEDSVVELPELFAPEFERDSMETTIPPPESQETASATADNNPVETEKQDNSPPKVEQVNPLENIQALVTKRSDRITAAHRSVRKYTLVSMAAGAIPLPALDLALLTGVQLDMLHNLSQRYAVPFSKNLAKSILSVLTSDALVFVTSTPAASLIKVIPIIGQISGTISMVTLSGAATYATGKVFIQHFESGGTFLDFDPEKARVYFQEFYKEGQQFAAQTSN